VGVSKTIMITRVSYIIAVTGMIAVPYLFALLMHMKIYLFSNTVFGGAIITSLIMALSYYAIIPLNVIYYFKMQENAKYSLIMKADVIYTSSSFIIAYLLLFKRIVRIEFNIKVLFLFQFVAWFVYLLVTARRLRKINLKVRSS